MGIAMAIILTPTATTTSLPHLRPLPTNPNTAMFVGQVGGAVGWKRERMGEGMLRDGLDRRDMMDRHEEESTRWDVQNTERDRGMALPAEECLSC